MVSKPKPGLGKGLVRTIQHGQHQYSIAIPASVSGGGGYVHLGGGSGSGSGSGTGSGSVTGHGHGSSFSTLGVASSSSHAHSHAHSHPSHVSTHAQSHTTTHGILALPSTSSHPSAHATNNKEKDRLDDPYYRRSLHSPIPIRHYTTLSSSRPIDILPLLTANQPHLHLHAHSQSYSLPHSDSKTLSLDFGAAKKGGDGSFNFSDFFPPPPPPSPGPPHPIPIPNSASIPFTLIGNTATHANPVVQTFGSSPGSGGVLLDTPGLARELTLPPTLPLNDDVLAGPSTAYASRLIFRYGSTGLAKDRPNLPPRKSIRGGGGGSGSATPPPRPRSFPIPIVDPPTSYTSTSIGEDAYYARADGMCVADGVGGWARSGKGGADAGKWSRLLTHFCEAEVKRWWDGKEEYVEDLLAGNRGEASRTGMGSGTSASTATGGVEGRGFSATNGWTDKLWPGNIRIKVKLKTHDDASGLPEGLRRRKLDPVEIMQRGFEKCLSCFLAEGIHGSSTCLLALLHHSQLLIANLGDCSLLVLRGGEIIFRTDEMQHAFNFPLQLGTHSRDEPMKDAKQYNVQVEKDDVVIVGSDGLMDNLFEDEIIDCLAEFAPPADPASISSSSSPSPAAPSPSPSANSTSENPNRPSSSSTPHRPPFDPQKVSEALCRAARDKSEDIASETPFMLRAAAEGIDFVGGKKDDISVIVGVIGARADGSELTRFKAV